MHHTLGRDDVTALSKFCSVLSRFCSVLFCLKLVAGGLVHNMVAGSDGPTARVGATSTSTVSPSTSLADETALQFAAASEFTRDTCQPY